MRAGRLRHKLLLQETTKTRTATGGFTETWTNVREVWASVDPIRGREYFENQRNQGEVTHKIFTRHMNDVTPGHRLYQESKSRAFNILSVVDVGERSRMLEIMAKEVVA